MSELLCVHKNVTIDKDEFALVVVSRHGTAVAATAIHRQDFERRIGGARFVEGVPRLLEEAGHLASTMTPKCIAVMIPADGQKTVIVTGRSAESLPLEYRAGILAEHVQIVRKHDPSIIVGPDMGNPEAVQDIASRTAGLLDYFTGLSEEAGGLSIDANGYTARGLVAAIRACHNDGAAITQRITIQGFGAVGAHAAHLLGELGCRIVAVSNKYVSLSDRNGLDVHKLLDYYMKHGDGGLTQYATDFGVSTSHRLDVLKVPTDIFIPAGPIDVLAVADELEDIRERDNEEVLDVADFHAATGVSLVVEGANHPFSPRAEQWLEAEGVRVLPDYIVNCGGLVGCWIEWEARHARASQSVSDLRELAPAALDRVASIVTENVREIVASGVSARDAADQIVARNREKLLAGRR